MAIESDNNRRAISELLKSADRSIKENNLDAALGFIERVFEIEQRNVYARAYKERILALKDALAKDNAPAVKKEAPQPVKAAPPTEKKKTEEKIPVVCSRKSRRRRFMSKPSYPKAVTLHIPHSPAALEAYRTLLTEIWSDGNVSAEEQSQIDSMKETFAITEKDHEEIERQVRIEAYLAAIREAWKMGVTSFVDIRKRFKISDQEHLSVEQKINQFLQSLKAKGTVLLLDDDQFVSQRYQRCLDRSRIHMFRREFRRGGIEGARNRHPGHRRVRYRFRETEDERIYILRKIPCASTGLLMCRLSS